MITLKQNTATRITVGPFFDVADGVTPLTSLTATSEKLTLVADIAGVPTLQLDANATASGGSNDLVHVTGDDAGYFDLELTAAQLNFVGNAKLSIGNAAAHYPVYHEIEVLEPSSYSLSIEGIERNGRGGRIWYVSTTGSSSNPGTNTSPKLTVANTISSCAAGDDILVLDGTYTVAAGMTLAKKNVWIRGQSLGAILNYEYDGSNAACLRITGDGCRVSSLKITTTVDGWPIEITDCHNVTIDGNDLDGPLDGLAIDTVSPATAVMRNHAIRGNKIACDYDGLLAYNTTGLLIEGNQIIARSTYAVSASSQNRGIFLLACQGEIRGNWIQASVPASGSNISGSPHELTGILVEGRSAVKIQENRIEVKSLLTDYAGIISGIVSTNSTAGSEGTLDLWSNSLLVSQSDTEATLYHARTAGTNPGKINVWDRGIDSTKISGNVSLNPKEWDDTLADSNELQADWTNGGRLDNILDARASQASVDDVPTNSEFNARTLPSADYAAAATALSTAQWTTARAGYLDNANVGGALASQADVNALNQSASRRVILATVGQYERPEAGSSNFWIEARTYDRDGSPANATGTPTLTPTGNVTGDLSANLGAATNPATGLYRWVYNVESTDTLEQVRFDFAGTVDGDALTLGVFAQVCDCVAATFTTADRSDLQAAKTAAQSVDTKLTSNRAGYLDNLNVAGLVASASSLAQIVSKTDQLDFTGAGGALKSESTNMRGTDGANTVAPDNAGIAAAAASAASADGKVPSLSTQGKANAKTFFDNGDQATTKTIANVTAPKQVTVDIGD